MKVKGLLIRAPDGRLKEITVNPFDEIHVSNYDIKWKRRGHSKIAGGVVYTLQRPGHKPLLLIRPLPGCWNDARKGWEMYREQPDGWFFIDNRNGNGSWHRLMDAQLQAVLLSMESNMDAYLAQMVVE